MTRTITEDAETIRAKIKQARQSKNPDLSLVDSLWDKLMQRYYEDAIVRASKAMAERWN